ncbi:electron-transferring-flavo protein dehydrogenase [Catenaria anguillulae PL171]|uniref:Electron transfer flavoprotein-ubiquinone oxidoreductase n=1 Tax=Catenaria anguillulae PL171 TaxID=765915 RepID=A0A1Y2HDK4_9FUNG|nr:electron-transferring-flavo protein dehydrogenase [Catenaria anguillulae PL171]
MHTSRPAHRATPVADDPLADVERFVDNTDVLIVGAGPAGLSAAIRIKQLAQQEGKEIRVMVIEKGAEVGAHMLSGNVLEPRALNELFPEWKEMGAPLNTPVKEDKMMLLTKSSAIPLPAPPDMHNDGNYIISLNQFAKWLGEQAEALEVEIYPGFAGAKPLLSADGTKLLGVQTGDMGINKDGTPSDNFEPGMQIRARVTLLAEGCHGSLSKQLIRHFNLREPDQFQTYGIGLKEVWEVPKEKHQPGLVMHSIGWPMDYKTYGGSFLYHWTDAAEGGRHLVSVGLVVGLDYWNVNLRPYMEFQRYKHHPAIAKHLEGGKCISYGARALNEGGLQSIPQLAFPGGALVGCAAGFLNVPKIKGTHTAMKSGMLAAEQAFGMLKDQPSVTESEEPQVDPIHLAGYQKAFEESWIHKELNEIRNVRPSFHNPLGMWGGLLYSGLETMILRGRVPWTLQHKVRDHESLLPKDQCPPIEYPKPDGVLSFDLLDNVARTGTNHNHSQPAHLRPKDPEVQVRVNLPKYDGPEAKFCPAGVYEYVDAEQPYTLSDGTKADKKFQINFQNCIHCKTCDIKDPSQNIDWTTPEGSGGPTYTLT